MMAGVLLSAPVISVYTAGLLSYLLLLLTMRPPALAADQQQHVEARRQGGARRRHARPAWASPSTWLQRWPGVRDALVMCYRLVIPAATWVSVGPLAGRGTLPLALSGVGSWRHTHYLFRGWHGCVQPLPLRLQALTCLGEWVLLVATMAALEPGLVPPSSPAATTQALLHLISSWGAVVVVPMVVAAYWERCLVTRYTTYCRGLAATAAATQHQQPSPRKAKRSSTRSTGSFGGARISTSLDMSSGSPASSSTRSTGSDGGALPQPAPCAAVDHSSHAPCQAVPEQQRGAVQQGLISSPSPQQQVVVGGACMQEVAPSSVQGSRPAAKVFTPATCITAASDAALKAAPAAPAAGAGGDAVVAASGMPAALRHQVALLLGQALADELAAAAASCVDYTRVGYVPRSEVVTVSVKVRRVQGVGKRGRGAGGKQLWGSAECGDRVEEGFETQVASKACFDAETGACIGCRALGGKHQANMGTMLTGGCRWDRCWQADCLHCQGRGCPPVCADTPLRCWRRLPSPGAHLPLQGAAAEPHPGGRPAHHLGPGGGWRGRGGAAPPLPSTPNAACRLLPGVCAAAGQCVQVTPRAGAGSCWYGAAAAGGGAGVAAGGGGGGARGGRNRRGAEHSRHLEWKHGWSTAGHGCWGGGAGVCGVAGSACAAGGLPAGPGGGAGPQQPWPWPLPCSSTQ
jgi:hypothetical protein